MRAHTIRIIPKKDDATAPPDVLAPLSDLDGFMIADPVPDFRDWKVMLRDGRKVGTVGDAIVDTTNMVVRYIEVKVDRHVIGAEDDTWLLVPARTVRVDDKRDVVVLDRLPAVGLAAAPRHGRGAPTPEQERELRTYYGPNMRRAALPASPARKKPPAHG